MSVTTGNFVPTINSDGSVDFLGRQGKTWALTMTLVKPDTTLFDLDGYTVRGQIRKTKAASSIIKSFTCAVANPTTDGVCTALLAAKDTKQIRCGKLPSDTASTYYYDIEAYTGSGDEEVVTTIIKGRIFIDGEVTR